MLNLNGSMTKAGIRYSTLWSEKFTDAYFNAGLREWLDSGASRTTRARFGPKARRPPTLMRNWAVAWRAS
jgi:hypothetical protein